jgi:hypothetical protein
MSELEEEVEQIDEGSFQDPVPDWEYQHARSQLDAKAKELDAIKRPKSQVAHNRALGRMKNTAVSKFLQTRKGDGKVRTEEIEQIDEGSMDNMNLSQLMKKHAHHHEIGGGSDRSYKALDAIEKHVKNKYGQKAHDKLVKSTEDHAHSAGGPPKHHKESADAPFKGPYKDAKGDVQDKSGAKHTAMSRAKHLAKMAAKKNAKLKEAVSDATTPTQAQATVAGKMSSLAQSIKSKKKTGKDEFDANPEFVSQVQPNASNY